MNDNILQFPKHEIKEKEAEEFWRKWKDDCVLALRRNPIVCNVQVTTWEEMENFAIKEGILPQPDVKMPDGVTHENFASKLDELLTNLNPKD